MNSIELAKRYTSLLLRSGEKLTRLIGTLGRFQRFVNGL